jgi:hypothetical protein
LCITQLSEAAYYALFTVAIGLPAAGVAWLALWAVYDAFSGQLILGSRGSCLLTAAPLPC